MNCLTPPAFFLRGVAVLACAALARPARCEKPNPDLVHAAWPAKWITCPGAAPRSPAVYHFRKRISLPASPQHFVVHVSADNRFALFVNGVRAGDGPARGDLDHWRFETFDLAPLLHPGENIVAATVWNYGTLAPLAQMSDQTGFIIQGDSGMEFDANTGGSWEVEEENGQGFQPINRAEINNYYAAAPGEIVDGSRYDWAWQTESTGGSWKPAVTVGVGEPGRGANGVPYGTGTGSNLWQLVPDQLPAMEYAEIPIGRIVRAQLVPDELPVVNPAEATAGTIDPNLATARLTQFPVTIAAHTAAHILVDRATMTTAYPSLVVSRGKGATLRLVYAEALIDAKGQKGNRDETAGRSIRGLTDTFRPDGGDHRAWTTLWWRAWRYLQLDVQTADEAVTIESLQAHFTGYPFRERAAFTASDPSIAKIWETGTRTARMNAHETYMDCPYWEQLQYIGDTRIQALISYVEFGDDRLARQALDAYDWSRTAEGLTASRYPSALPQVIPTFSLLWIGMLHDYWLYRPDTGKLAEWTQHTRTVIAWYVEHQRPDGLLGLMPWWNFGDWTKDFVSGVPPQDPDGGSALLSLSFMAALRDAADLEESFGNVNLAKDYRRRAGVIGRALQQRCWVEAEGLLADTPAHSHYSEQTNALGVLLDVVPEARQQAVLKAVLEHRPLSQPPATGEFSPASIYFRFYLARALDHAGLADDYLNTLGPWHRMLALGLTTWAETAEPTRSDDHAWSSHPNYDLLTIVAGIRPASPGFRTVQVAPHPGLLTALDARMPHPAGDITVHYEKTGNNWTFAIDLPRGLTGIFLWNGQSTPLGAGSSRLTFPAH